MRRIEIAIEKSLLKACARLETGDMATMASLTFYMLINAIVKFTSFGKLHAILCFICWSEKHFSIGNPCAVIDILITRLKLYYDSVLWIFDENGEIDFCENHHAFFFLECRCIFYFHANPFKKYF